MILRSKDLAIKRSCHHKPATAAVASGPVPAPSFLLQRASSNEQVGEEAATPGQPVALARVFWSVRRRFTLENRRLPLALPQSSGKLRNAHVSLNPLSATLLRPATQKTFPLVQKLWTMRLPCGSRRKTKELISRRIFANQHFQ